MPSKTALPRALLPALLLASRGLAYSIVAHQNSLCTQTLQLTSAGTEVANSELDMSVSITDWDNGAGYFYDELDFPGNVTTSGSAVGTGSANVYWAVGEDPDPGCQLILMKDNGQGWQTINPLPGSLVLRVSTAGCYYSSLSPKEGVITSYCCGDDCTRVELESNGGNPTKRDVVPAAEAEQEEKKRAAPALSNAARAGDAVRRLRTRDDAPECTIVDNENLFDFQTSGVQLAVTQPQHCDTGPGTCQHTVHISADASTAVSASSSQSWTVTGGASISVKAGVDFIVDAEVTGELSVSIAQGWTNETGTTVTTGTTNGTTQQLVQQVGTNGYLSFTPLYNCWQGDASCGADADGNEILVSDMAFCQPATDGSGKLSGQYNMVYVDHIA
ncbi:hypothetical protein GGR56DRAFT_683185 [Xylariaceae sp. FL0804]|nr:hypothetical protein GGR56DRAFT_683185 [Xylariaceae sp. FL0804]